MAEDEVLLQFDLSLEAAMKSLNQRSNSAWGKPQLEIKTSGSRITLYRSRRLSSPRHYLAFDGSIECSTGPTILRGHYRPSVHGLLLSFLFVGFFVIGTGASLFAAIRTVFTGHTSIALGFVIGALVCAFAAYGVYRFACGVVRDERDLLEQEIQSIFQSEGA